MSETSTRSAYVLGWICFAAFLVLGLIILLTDWIDVGWWLALVCFAAAPVGFGIAFLTAAGDDAADTSDRARDPSADDGTTFGGDGGGGD